MYKIVFREAVAEDIVLLGHVLQVAVHAREQHLNRGADDLEVAELLGGYIHQHVVFVGIGVVACESLNEILHGSFQLAVAAAELFEQQTGETRIGTRYASIVLEFFGVVKHTLQFSVKRCERSALRRSERAGRSSERFATQYCRAKHLPKKVRMPKYRTPRPRKRNAGRPTIGRPAERLHPLLYQYEVFPCSGFWPPDMLLPFSEALQPQFSECFFMPL